MNLLNFIILIIIKNINIMKIIVIILIVRDYLKLKKINLGQFPLIILLKEIKKKIL